MRLHHLCSVLVLAVGSGFVAPLLAQDIGGRIVIYGRIEDAASRQTVGGVRVFLADSSSVVYADSLGTFGIPVPASGPFTVWAERFGYLSQRFELGEDAPSQLSVLRLEPAPIAIEGITAEAEAALTVLVEGLENRRNSYPYRVRSFDRAGLDRLAQPGTVWDFIRVREPRITFCSRDPFQLCVPGRFRSLRSGRRENPVSVCVDEWLSFFPSSELQTMPIEAVALLEVYQGQIRVYTTGWMLSRADVGRTRVRPLIMGCGG